MPKNHDQLAQYGVQHDRGFLPAQDPLVDVPTSLKGWHEIATELPKLLVANKLSKAVEAMPLVSIDGLRTEAELERAMLAFSFVGHAYVWGTTYGKPKLPSQLPESLAVPWHSVAKKLGRPPVLSYASYALHNWKRIDKESPIELGNIALIQNFLGGIDEEWFILVHVDIEKKAAEALTPIFPAQRAAQDGDEKVLEAELKKIEKALASIYETLLRMPEHCDPYIYYNRVRPYIHGWKDHPLYPNGLVYAGVGEYGGKGQFFRGETGAQSSIIPALDAALGVVHAPGVLKTYLDEMRDYMPPKHRAFIEAIEHNPSIRKFVVSRQNSNEPLSSVYNQCIDWVERFRAKHLEYAKQYIFSQNQVNQANPSMVGTGGTPFVPYLSKHQEETAEHKLSTNPEHPKK
jgi:indoleamine 2,3-dioxygenase